MCEAKYTPNLIGSNLIMSGFVVGCMNLCISGTPIDWNTVVVFIKSLSLWTSASINAGAGTILGK